MADERRERFEPALVWTEDRWILCRRMAGDDLCQRLFYKLATFIWRTNQIEGDLMRAHQDKLITTVFNYDNRREFLDKVDHPLTVETWDGKICAFMSVDYVGEMFREVCFLGPLAAMYGREVQQLLMANDTPDKISMEDFQYSVDMGRRSIKQAALRSSAKRNYDMDTPVESDRHSQVSVRTCSPRHDQDRR